MVLGIPAHWCIPRQGILASDSTEPIYKCARATKSQASPPNKYSKHCRHRRSVIVQRRVAFGPSSKLFVVRCGIFYARTVHLYVQIEQHLREC